MPRGGGVDHAQKGVVVVGVDGETQVGERVFDFLTLVKAQAAVDFVGNAGGKQGLFDDARLGVAAVEHGHVVEPPAFALQGFGFVDDELCFVEIYGRGVEADFVAVFGVGAQIFAEPLGVVFDYGVGGGEDVAVRTVVLFELNRLFDVEFAHQGGHVADVGAAEAVDGLVVVAHCEHGGGVARH